MEINKYLLDSFINNADKKSLALAIKEVIKSINISDPYDNERFINNFINIIATGKLIDIKDIDKEKVYHSVCSMFDDPDVIDKDKIVILAVDNIYDRIRISYGKVNETYEYTTICYDISKFKK